MKLLLNALDLIPRSLRLLVIQVRGGCARQSPVRAVHNRHHHFQIAQQFGAGPRRSFFLSLRFEKQRRIVQNALADCRRSPPPCAVQLRGLAVIAVMLGEDRRHPLAILQTLSRHRHQKLHRRLRSDFAFAHLLLNRFRQLFHQGQPSRYPTHTTIKPSRQLLQSVAETLLQLGQQPTHLQRGLMLAQAQRAVQQHRRSLAHRPNHGLHRVPSQLLYRRDPLVAVDHHVTVRLAFHRHHHDRRLLAHFRQRRQQSPLPRRMAHSQVLPTPVELVKLQLHRTG